MELSEDRLRALIEPWLAAEHLELDDVELVGSGRVRVLRVIVDSDGGIDVDRLADISLGVSRLLDEEAGIDNAYQLEVSSPGLERKLRTPRHYQKSVGREVHMKIRADQGSRVLKGTLVDVSDDAVTVDVSGDAERIGLADVLSARTVFRWERAPKPGKK